MKSTPATERMQKLVDGRPYNWLLIAVAYIAVFVEPVLMIWIFSSDGQQPIWLGGIILAINTVTTLVFTADFFINFRLQGRQYLKYTSAWINLLVMVHFLTHFFTHFIPLDPALLRLLRTTGVVARLGLLQKAGRLESNLASWEIFRNNEDDIKYSIVLILAFSLLTIQAVATDYNSVWQPLLEIGVYLVVIFAVRYKVHRNWSRITDNLVYPLRRLTEQNRSRLATLIGEAQATNISDETLRQLLKEGKNEIDLIVEQVDQIFRHLKKFVSERTLRESRGETVIPPHQPIAMSFSDIEGFTDATQAMQTQIIPVLAFYLHTMSANILRHRGDIEKFVGDAVFAYYYDPVAPELSANNGFDSVLDCLKGVRALWNEPQWKALFAHGDWEQFKNFRTRFGMHYGTVTAGPIGSVDEQLRVESTLIGDHVNITSRLEGLGKHYGLYNLMSEDFYRQLSPDRQERCRQVDRINVKGRHSDPFTIYTIDIEARPDEFLQLYQQGLQAYFSGDWAAALKLLQSALRLAPDDGPSLALISRIESSKHYSLRALDNISRKVSGQLETYNKLREELQQAIEKEPYLPPLDFVERGGYWRWDEK